MKILVILAFAGLAVAQQAPIQIQLTDNQRRPIQIQTPTINVQPRQENPNWQQPNQPEWNWQQPVQPIQPLPEVLPRQPEHNWNLPQIPPQRPIERPDRPHFPQFPQFPQPEQPIFPPPRAAWREGQIDARCPSPDDHEGFPVFLPGSGQWSFFICWGRRAFPFQCPPGTVFRTEVNVCADPGWTPSNRFPRPFEDESKTE